MNFRDSPLGTALRRTAVSIVSIASIASIAATVTACAGSDPTAEHAGVVALDTVDPAADAVLYDAGPTAIALADGRTNEATAAVYFPSSWSAQRSRVVFIQHGGHSVCSTDVQWPCERPQDRTPSYLGYGYLAEELVAAGYVVVSVSANGTVGRADVTRSADVFDYFTDLLDAASSTTDGPFGDTFSGRIDLDEIGMIGHSRGGDAVARYTSAGRTAVGGVVLLAPVVPVDYPNDRRIDAGDVDALVLVGTCDADAGSDGLLYRSAFGPIEAKVSTIEGANHNFYNTQWTPGSGVADAVDDALSTSTPLPGCAPTSPTRLSAEQQHAAAIEAAVPFMVSSVPPLAP